MENVKTIIEAKLKVANNDIDFRRHQLSKETCLSRRRIFINEMNFFLGQ